MFDAGAIGVRMIMDHLDFMVGMSAVEKGILLTARRFETLGHHIQRFTAPLMQFRQQAVQAFSSFQSAFAEVKKTVEGTPEQMQKIERSIRDMALEIPFAVEEIANVASIAGQLGVPTESIQKFTKVILDMGVTTDMTTEEAATSMARLATIMKVPTEQFENLGSSINLLGARGAATESEIVNMSLRMGALGTQVGLLPHEILALSEALSSVGVQAELGGGTMTRMFSIFSDVTKTGGKKLAMLNKIAGTDFKKAFEDDAKGALITFVQGLNRIDAEGGNVIGMLKEAGLKGTGFSQVIAGLQQSSEKLALSFETGAQGWGESGRLAEEASKRYETFGSQMTLMKNQINDIAIEVGEVLVPFMQKLNTQILDLIKIWRSLNEQQKLTIIYIGGVTTAIAPLLLNIGKLTHFLFNIARAIKTVGVGISFITSMAGLGAVAPFAPWILGIGALAAAIVGLVSYIRSPDGWQGVWDTARVKLLEYWELAKGFVANFGTNMKMLGDWFLNNWRNIIHDVGRVFAALFRSIPELALVALMTWARLQVTWHGWLIGRAKALFDFVFSQEFLKAVIKGITQAWAVFRAWFTALNQAFLNFVMRMGTALMRAAPFIKDLLVGMITMRPVDVAIALAGVGAELGKEFSTELDAAGSVIEKTGKQLMGDFKTGMDATNPFPALAGVVKDGVDKAKGVLDREFGKETFKTEALPEFKFDIGKEMTEPVTEATEAVSTMGEEAKMTGEEIEKMLQPLKEVETVAFGSAEHIRGLMTQQRDAMIQGVGGGVEAVVDAKNVANLLGPQHAKNAAMMASIYRQTGMTPEQVAAMAAEAKPVPVTVADSMTDGEEAIMTQEELLKQIAANTDPRNQDTLKLDPVNLP